MTLPTSILWFRQDLRIADHPALLHAAQRGVVAPVYIRSPLEAGNWPPGGASNWWLHHSLKSLAGQLAGLGARLILREGNPLACLRELVKELNASAVYWSRCYEPASIQRDKRVKQSLREDGLEVETFNASLLYEPWEVETKAGGPYQVFTPYWKACQASGADHDPLEAPEKVRSPARRGPTQQNPTQKTPTQKTRSLALDSLKRLPKLNWAKQFYDQWNVGAPAAEAALEEFIANRLDDYSEDRNRLDIPGSSRLSPHLHFGELSPRQVWASVRAAASGNRSLQEASRVYLAEIGWREFAYHLLYHFPTTTNEPLCKKFADFPWSSSKKNLEAWQRGETGYPVVDAAMRDLMATGFMPNRARMIVASFLTKHLRIRWQCGAEWFWDTLVDADLANNTLGWQWTAGCGADAAPYFRIFNPITQGEKFDPHGGYVRRWVPEIAGLPDKLLNQPWKASESERNAAGVKLGKDYPLPIVDHAAARTAALEAYQQIK